ncbi:MAG: hypothetical protein KAS32_26925 [Candidatus Peribacteraceae bacterium]|nr:hypothetical protein [Candidatus Peribacteraceae bacterium]
MKKIFETTLKITQASEGPVGFTNITGRTESLDKNDMEDRQRMVFSGAGKEVDMLCFVIPEENRVAVGDIITVTFETPGVR